MQLGFLLMTKNVNAYGFIATSAYGIGNKINSIITMPANGIGSAISTIVGQNIGAGQKDRADKAYHYALRMGALFLLFFGLILSRRFISQAMVTFSQLMKELFRWQQISSHLWHSGAGATHFTMSHRDFSGKRSHHDYNDCRRFKNLDIPSANPLGMCQCA